MMFYSHVEKVYSGFVVNSFVVKFKKYVSYFAMKRLKFLIKDCEKQSTNQMTFYARYHCIKVSGL